MSNITLMGKPLARFYIRNLQSWNEVFGKGHWSKKGRVVKMWRKRGESLGLKWRERNGYESKLVVHWVRYDQKMKRTGHHYEPIVTRTRVLVVVKVVRGSEHKYDVHNVFVKALLDGFSDAGLWTDDEWAYVPMVLFTWARDVKRLGQHFVIEIHELGDFIVNGVAQVLPEGRGDGQDGE